MSGVAGERLRPMADFRPTTCQWPHGDPRDPDFRFCGAPVAAPGVPYCAAHMRRAYRVPDDPDGAGEGAS